MAAIDKLTQQFKDSTNLKNLFQPCIDQVNELSDTFDDLNTDTGGKRSIDTAEGVQVDRNAEQVGLAGLNLSDANTIEITKIHALINTSFGAVDDTMESASRIGEFINSESIVVPLDVLLIQDFPATIIVEVIGFIQDTFKSFFRKAIEKTKAGGVRLIIRNPSSIVTHFAYDTVGAGYDSTAPFVGEIL